MDDYLCGEEQFIKARKPYTITKQRERWTDEEHNRFLEALKLYGRAWQRIEEHIGTKTAVQIRSHAQKFFSKLEKEAQVKGVPVGQAIDIAIPPPRPKKKPNTPYPRKASAASSPNTQLRVNDGKPIQSGPSPTRNLDLEKQPLPQITAGTEENCGHEACSEVVTLFKDTPCTLAASTDENSATTAETRIKPCDLKEPVSMEKQVGNNDRYVLPDPQGPNRNCKDDNPGTVMTAQNDTGNEMHAAKNLPTHTPVQILDGSIGASSQAPSSDVSFQESSFHHMGIPGHPALFSYPAVSPAVESQNSTSRSNHQPSFYPPFTMLPNIQEYIPYMQISSSFSNLIMSALLQNPAAHAAASFAASFWPSTNAESAPNCPSSTNYGVFQHKSLNTAPSMAGIVAATVAAATAWWAAHGLLPLCSPHHAAFTCPPSSATNPLASVVQTQANGEKRMDNNFHDPGLQVQHADQEIPKYSEMSSSDSGNGLGAKKGLVTAADCNNKDVPAMTEQKDLSLTKSTKQVERSSCGSNTPSGSDAETDALEKNDKGNEQPKEPDSCQPANETGNRRSRVAGCINDNWKAVSEGGRLAFQALFTRERLPQSFSPPHEDTGIQKQTKDGVDETRQNAVKNKEDASKLDLNCNTWESYCLSDQGLEKRGLREEENSKDGLLTIGLQGKLKTHKTGFKPYKRCSVEATTMNSSSQHQEQRCKRLCSERQVEGEAST